MPDKNFPLNVEIIDFPYPHHHKIKYTHTAVQSPKENPIQLKIAKSNLLFEGIYLQ